MKHTTTIALALAACMCAPRAHAQVYKCPAPGGGHSYSQQPCSPGSEPIKVRASRGASLSEGELAQRAEVGKSTSMSDVAIRARGCISAANERIYSPSNARVAGYRREIAGLNAQISQAANNLAGATWESGMREQISALHGAIATEQASAATQMTAARAQCDAERRDAEREVKDRFADAP